MTEPTIAICRSYDELHAALRARADALDVSRQTLDEVSGLQSGYCSKLLAPVPIKGIGRASLAPLLGALGLKILLVEDAEMLARLASRMDPRKPKGRYANGAMPTTRHSQFKGNSEWGRVMRARAVLILSPAKRSSMARRAALARWRKPKPKGARAAGTSAAAAPASRGPKMIRPRSAGIAATKARALPLSPCPRA